MAWYDTGTVTVTNGSTTVTGSGTDFLTGVQVGEAFYAPDDNLYEIASITSATQLLLADNYAGSTQSSQSYKVVPTQSLVADLSKDVTDLITDYAEVKDKAVDGKFDDGTVTDPAIRFYDDTDTGFYRVGANEIGVSVGGVQKGGFDSDGLTMPDSAKAKFGASDDLEIYHNGSASYIEEKGTGSLYIKGTQLRMQATDGTTYLEANDGGALTIKHNGSTKLSTTSSGVDVIGTVNADGLTVENSNLQIKYSENDGTYNPRLITYFDSNGTHLQHTWSSGASNLIFEVGGAEGSGTERMRIDSTGKVGIGTSTVNADLHINKSSGAKLWITAEGSNPSDAGSLRFAELNNGNNYFEFKHDGSNNKLNLTTTNGDLVTFDRNNSSVGIGKAPQFLLDVNGNANIQGNVAPTGNGIGIGDYGTTGGYKWIQTFSSQPLSINPLGNNVGINNSSPNRQLSVNNYSGNGTLSINAASSGASTMYFSDGATGTDVYTGFIQYNHSNNAMQFATNGGQERMRIDSSGRVLVGTTNIIAGVGNTDTGVSLSSSLGVIASRASEAPLNLSRNTNDGDIAIFRKDGSSVGSIGVINGDNLRIGGTVANHAGLQFGTNIIYPESGASSNIADGVVDIGNAGGRFKDGHFSGTGYFGTSVGIGTSSPNEKLHVNGSLTVGVGNSKEPVIQHTNSGRVASNPAYSFNGDLDTGMFNPNTNNTIAFATGGSERMRINSSGNVMASTTTDPVASGSVSGLYYKADQYFVVSRDSAVPIYSNRQGSDGDVIGLRKNGTTIGRVATYSGTVQFGQGNANLKFSNASDAITPANGNGTNNNNAIDLGSTGAKFKDAHFGGNVLIGTSTVGGVGHTLRGSDSAIFNRDASGETVQVKRNSSSGQNIRFYNGTSEVGNISTTSSSTSYNTSSDYRLKEDVKPVANASDRLMQLNPVNFAWKADGIRVDGFLAHEAQEVVPEAVSGEKDAMRTEEYEVTPAIEATYDDDGNELTPAVEAVMGEREVPDYQGIDQSKLVPLLTAALQESLTKIESLESRLVALETE